MGTRGVIARAKGDGWEGRYHHWDSYPTGLGKRLQEVYQQIGLARMKKLLIDEHPVGWSTILACDITKQPGYREPSVKHPGEPQREEYTDFNRYWDDHAAWEAKQGPQCYCHGDRHETEELLITDQSDDAGTEWAYVLAEKAPVMTVYKRRYGPERWSYVGQVHLDTPDFPWERMEQVADEED